MTRRTRRLVTPVLCYLAITVGVPLAGGAYAQPEFVAHAITVLLVTATLLCLVCPDHAKLCRMLSRQRGNRVIFGGHVICARSLGRPRRRGAR